MLKKQLADVQVLETRDRWFGVTYAEDKAYVTDSIQALVKGGSTLKNSSNKRASLFLHGFLLTLGITFAPGHTPRRGKLSSPTTSGCSGL